jgi:hypothetical protein
MRETEIGPKILQNSKPGGMTIPWTALGDVLFIGFTTGLWGKAIVPEHFPKDHNPIRIKALC